MKKSSNTDQSFLAEFLSYCASNGIKSQNSICDLARVKITEIDEKIKELEALKRKRSNYIGVLNFLNQKLDQVKYKEFNSSLLNQLMFKKSISFLKKNKSAKFSLVASELSLLLEAKEEAYFVLKELAAAGIVQIDSKSDLLTHGPNWSMVNEKL